MSRLKPESRRAAQRLSQSLRSAKNIRRHRSADVDHQTPIIPLGQDQQDLIKLLPRSSYLRRQSLVENFLHTCRKCRLITILPQSQRTLPTLSPCSIENTIYHATEAALPPGGRRLRYSHCLRRTYFLLRLLMLEFQLGLH